MDNMKDTTVMDNKYHPKTVIAAATTVLLTVTTKLNIDSYGIVHIIHPFKMEEYNVEENVK